MRKICNERKDVVVCPITASSLFHYFRRDDLSVYTFIRFQVIEYKSLYISYIL